MKFYKSAGFKELNKNWRRRLEESGFKDEEDDIYRLKQKDVRSIGFQNKEIIADFYTALGGLLEHCHCIPKRDRQILELYVHGTWIVHIKQKLGLTNNIVQKTVNKYRVAFLLDGFPLGRDSEDTASDGNQGTMDYSAV